MVRTPPAVTSHDRGTLLDLEILGVSADVQPQEVRMACRGRSGRTAAVVSQLVGSAGRVVTTDTGSEVTQEAPAGRGWSRTIHLFFVLLCGDWSAGRRQVGIAMFPV